MKKIAILGASGSIGTNTIEVIRRHPKKFDLVSFSLYSKTNLIEPLLEEFKNVYLVCVKSINEIKDIVKRHPNIKFVEGNDGLLEVASCKANLIVNALVGFTGLLPTLKAIESNKNVALANKETLVVAGQLINKQAKKHNVKILPIDSEHSAIFQCLEKENKLKNIIITASGGPFFRKTLEELDNVSVEQALNHPTWVMGAKITIDSATMFNKAFEVIEAYHLFHVKPEQIKVVIHPQSVVHSMVEFKDGGIKAQLGVSDMKLPIAYALNYPHRLDNISSSLDFSKVNELNFYEVDLNRFKPLALAYEALKQKGTYPAVLNGANEEAVRLFLDGKIKFNDIYNLVKEALDNHINCKGNLTIKKILKADRWARDYVLRRVK